MLVRRSRSLQVGPREEMKSCSTRYVLALTLLYLLSGEVVQAEPIRYDNRTAFLTNLVSSTTFDFETSSGFPDAGGGFAPIGPFAGISFDATTRASAQATSGGQVMAGRLDAFSPAVLDFTGLTERPSGFGFFGLDLTAGEFIRTTVNFSDGTSQVYDVSLGGQPPFTPSFFGVIDPSNTIASVSIRGTDPSGVDRAWLIDDATVGVAVPEPTSLALLGLGTFGLLSYGLRRRLRQPS